MLRPLLYAAALAKLSEAAYTLESSYTASNFFSQFSFYTGSDPTNGYVTYVDQGTAQSGGLINTNNNQVYLGVDHQNVASGSGRQSVRLTSNTAYNHGLFILDLAHMPGSICGTWPAFWMFGPNWPNSGEIDIIEGVNTQTNNAYTLHTSDGCTISNSGFTGALQTSNCYVDAAGQSSNAGCDIQDTRSNSYGDGFNSAGGGVFATQWTSSAINIWYFNAQAGIPANIQNGNPDPTTWGTPVASFAGSCDIDTHFANMNLVFDITFCGDWAGAVFSSNPTCSSQASSCTSFVQNNPGAFAPAYWLINSLKVYQSSTNGVMEDITVPAANNSGNAVVGGIKGLGTAYVNSTDTTKPESEAPIKSEPLARGGGYTSSKLRRNILGAL